MRYRMIGTAVALMASIGLTACTMGTQQDNAAEIYQTTRENFLEQQSYYFDGSTEMRSDSMQVRNMVVFNGRVRNRQDVLMNLQLTFPEISKTDELMIASLDRKMYAKFPGEKAWQTVTQTDRMIRDEFNNWNPAFHFRQMDEMKQRIEPVDGSPQGDLAQIRVVLDPGKMKKWLAGEMRKQSGQVNQLHVKRIGQRLQLADGEVDRLRQDIKTQSKETQRMIDGIINTLQVEGEYILSVDTTRYLPTKLELNLRSQYMMNGESVSETTRVHTYLRDYGRSVSLPADIGE